MSNPESENFEASEPLELNKETIQDLDVEASDARDVKGGGHPTQPQPPGAGLRLSTQCQITPSWGGEITPYQPTKSIG